MTKSGQPRASTGYRASAHINRKVSQSVFDAFEFAADIGRPLNTYVVINLREGGSMASATIFTAIRHKYRDWLTHRRRAGHPGCVPTYVYALENPTDLPHANWVVHVPPGLEREFSRKVAAWVRKTQDEVGPFDIHLKSVVAGYAKLLAKYILKGTQADFIDHFHLRAVYEGPQGIVWGKRAGCSPSLGRAAREEAGFKRPRRRFANWPRPASDRTPAMHKPLKPITVDTVALHPHKPRFPAAGPAWRRGNP